MMKAHKFNNLMRLSVFGGISEAVSIGDSGAENSIDFLRRGLTLALFITASLLSWRAAAQISNQNNAALTLGGAIEEGLNHSPDIQRVRASASEQHWHKFETLGGGFLPQVSIQAHHFFAEQYTSTGLNLGGGTLSFAGFFPTDQAALEVSIPIFDGFANVSSYQAASFIEEASQKELNHAEFQLKQNIRLAFYKALAAAQLQAVAEQNVKTLEDHLKQVNVQRRGGVATNYDTLRVEVLLSEARADAIDALDSVVLTRKKLTQFLGLEVDDRPLNDSLPTPDSNRVKSIQLTDATKERADIQALNLRAQAASKSESASKSWLVPQISIGGEYFYYQQQFVDTSVHDTGVWAPAYDMAIFLKWNIFDGGVSLARGQEAAFRQIQAEKASETAKIQIPYDFAYWKRRYISNTDHYLSKKFDITRSEESVRLAREEQKAGTRTSTETLDAELDLFRSRAGVVNAQVNAIEAEIQLELALGREI